ncbi:SubName: Full=Uncharacterized protein {ECO:0000313/EMBL:CCA67869.1} [Serendipita indica DSM 11827]|uniref:DUF7053 domain-containing protein n=1 Tax=Serendipita indica (strain DSM 11827) TaxID=1109443 RepID=G4T966_SERID|nr:SubName: Full=Uncharacterized protein {ECO:0000313/EMBL:CCA67869.1} [Serendipita indica DSM 11827]CCA67869.1 hypothetical protein PIIN_01693 [Serendipita indica DSM 11827]
MAAQIITSRKVRLTPHEAIAITHDLVRLARLSPVVSRIEPVLGTKNEWKITEDISILGLYKKTVHSTIRLEGAKANGADISVSSALGVGLRSKWRVEADGEETCLITVEDEVQAPFLVRWFVKQQAGAARATALQRMEEGQFSA